MIRINLLTVERERTKKRSSGGFTFGSTQKMTLAYRLTACRAAATAVGTAGPCDGG